VYEILNIINTEHKVKNNFMFFEAYRNNSQQTTKAGLTNNQYGPSYLNFQPIQNMRNLSNSIGISTSFITQATKKFGQILRESVENGERKIMFEENTEYLDLKKYFLKFGYNLNLECIDINNNVYQFYLLRKGVKVEVDLISSGEREIMNFLFGLFMDKMNDGIIIIDEPELHIHPNWQKKIIDIFKEETKKKNIQIFFVTHSSSFIKYDILNNIFRIYMDKNGYSKHVKLNTSYKTNKEIREALNIINSTNNEKIFFSNYVILVEGITDQIIFNMILKESYLENNTEVEIININGKLNFKKYEQILSKLKIKCFYIGDRDNLKGYPETKKYFNTDSKKVLKEIKEEKTNDYEEFVSSLNKLKINNNKKNSLSVISIYSKIQAKNLSEKTTLSETEEKEIIDHIKNKENQGIYILKRGEIEQYIGILGHNKEKAFEMAVQIANDDKKKNEWKATDESKELYEIVEKIIIDIKNEQK
jgi:predicted ATPase